MSAKNAFGYYLLKRVEMHLFNAPTVDWEALELIGKASLEFCDARHFAAEEQRLAITVANYQRWQDVPDFEQPSTQEILHSTAGLDPVFAEVPRG